jgi:lipopolysaccharide transport system ATP-binding protein
MYVRLAFAVAAHLEPEILIIDEVLAVGDIQFQSKCLGKLDEVGGSGKRVLFVSHNINAIAQLCTRGILLDAGKLISKGSIESALQDYMHKGGGLLYEKAWTDTQTMPGSDELKLRRVSILPKNGQTIACDVPITIEIEVIANTDMADVAVGIVISNTARGDILHTESAIQGVGTDLKAGSHLYRYSLPPNILAEGRYSLTMGVANPNTCQHILEFDFLTFSLHSTNSHFIRYPRSAWRGHLDPGIGTWTLNE